MLIGNGRLTLDAGTVRAELAEAVALRRDHQRRGKRWLGRLLRRPERCRRCRDVWPCPAWRAARALVITRTRWLLDEARAGRHW